MADEDFLRPRPTVLLILDGFGIAPDEEGNAVTRAHMPNMKTYTQRYPVVTLKASGETVGLMWGEMGNSEVGHLTIGSGRVYNQALPRIEQSIDSGTFFENATLVQAMDRVKDTGGTLHIIGILSSGKVHGYDKHIHTLVQMAKKRKCKRVALHIILDGRDTLYNAGIDFVEQLRTVIRKAGVGEIATIMGRYYAMDRDSRWDRTERAYRAIVEGISDEYAQDPIEAIKQSYAQDVFDEEMKPVVCTDRQGRPLATVQPGDAIVFSNFRADRARQLTKSLVLPTFTSFERTWIEDVYMVTMTEYEKGLPVHVVFPHEEIQNTLAEVLARAGMVQLHIAETEKYAHITFFLNGMREKPFDNEDRKIIPSPQIGLYSEQPEMSSYEITDTVLQAVQSSNYDAIFVNFANPDMVAHTGDFEATIKADEVIDACVGKIVQAVLAKNGCVLITADHGNAEEVKNLQTGDIDKEHSTNPVPFFMIANDLEGKSGLSGDIPGGDLSLIPPIGTLADIAPTMLKIMHIEPPSDMTGTALL